MEGTSSCNSEISLLGSINQGEVFLVLLKLKHAVLVRICDVFETTYPGSQVFSLIFQAGSVGDRFSPLCWQSVRLTPDVLICSLLP